MLLSVLFDQYRLRAMRSASPKSIKLSRFGVKRFEQYLGRCATLEDLTDDTVSRFVLWRRDHVAPTTVNRDLAVILALWRWGHRQGLIDRWPNVPQEPEPKRIPVAWTQDEFDRLMAVAAKQPGRVGRNPAGLWWTALLLVLFDSGERIGAVLSLSWPRVDLRGRWVVFDALSRKGRREDNACRIAEDTAAALQRLHRTRGVVFEWPYARDTIWLRYGRIVAAAGLPNDRKHKFHCVRKTTASHYVAAGGDATTLLKHSSRSVTLAYIDPRIALPPQGIDLLWRPRIRPQE